MNRYKRDALLALPLLALATGSTAASAQAVATGPATYSVILRHADVHPRSPQAARAMLTRIGEAAMEACGVSSFSLREMKLSIKKSACWRDSVAEVVTRTGDPMLAEAYAKVRQRHRG